MSRTKASQDNITDQPIEELAPSGEGISLGQSAMGSEASDIVFPESLQSNLSGQDTTSQNPPEFIDYTKDLIPNQPNHNTQSEQPLSYPEWNKMPVIKNQLELYPTLCERVLTRVLVLDFTIADDVDHYQNILNQAQGEAACIKIRNSIIKFSEKTGNFIALVVYDTFKFKRPL